jgi:PIN domain nuclease of toxin-antitoxin system
MAPSSLLLDTHILIWWLADSPRLSRKALKLIQDTAIVWVSAVSAWEIESKRARGLLDAPDDLEATLMARDLRLLSLTVAHAIAAARLPMHHRDPIDRMLVAQASLESLTLLTADRQQSVYDVPVILA